MLNSRCSRLLRSSAAGGADYATYRVLLTPLGTSAHASTHPCANMGGMPHAPMLPVRMAASGAQHAGSRASSRRGRRIPMASSPPATAVSTIKYAEPDLVLEGQGSPHRILVFGIEHTSPQPHIAEYILHNKPHAVVVETAMTPEHGACPGNTVSCKDRVVEGPGAFFLRMFCQVSSELKKEAESWQGHIMATGLWHQIRDGQYRGEQLVYVAALATNALLVFGDRPKDITYRRLYAIPTVAQLDEGYAAQTTLNYRVMLGEAKAGDMPGRETTEAGCIVDQIMMQEREAVMLAVASRAAAGTLPQVCAGSHELPGHEASAAEAQRTQGDVVMVVGSAHLPGLKTLWDTGRWKELLGAGGSLEGSPVLTAPPLSTVPAKETGVRRGLLRALLRLGCTDEVLADVEQTLGPISQHDLQAYEAISEIYGVTRTMLSCLPRDVLNKVVLGAPTENGQRGDFYTTLEPLRQLRPSRGGPGYSQDAVDELRSLNFDLD